MRPVNLLPEGQRPRRPSGSGSGGAYVVVGVLGSLLVLMLVWVFFANGVASRKEQLAEAKTETAAAEAQSKALGAFGNFAQVAKTRSQSVRELAGARFDWERFVRELALVLPRDAWLTEVDASVSGTSQGGQSSPAPSSGAATGPSAGVAGCAKRQPDVAELMVRLRKMHRVDDVTLEESSSGKAGAPGSGGGAAPSTSSPASGSTGASGGADCGRAYQFRVRVTFEPPSPAPAGDGPRTERLPARLGGGS